MVQSSILHRARLRRCDAWMVTCWACLSRTSLSELYSNTWVTTFIVLVKAWGTSSLQNAWISYVFPFSRSLLGAFLNGPCIRFFLVGFPYPPVYGSTNQSFRVLCSRTKTGNSFMHLLLVMHDASFCNWRKYNLQLGSSISSSVYFECSACLDVYNWIGSILPLFPTFQRTLIR